MSKVVPCPVGYNISFANSTSFPCLVSSSKMSEEHSSPIPSAEHSTLSRLATISQTLVLNVSWAESDTLMEEFTSMYSSISDGSLAVEKLIYSMWEAITLTSQSVAALRGRRTTTQSKMETLWQVGSTDPTKRAEMALGRLILRGIQSSRLKLLKSFGHFAMTWLHEILLARFPHFRNTATGDIALQLDPTVLQMGLSLTRHALQSSTSGSCKLIWDLENWD